MIGNFNKQKKGGFFVKGIRDVIVMRKVIVVKPHPAGAVGSIFDYPGDKIDERMRACEGQFLPVYKFPELYSTIHNDYCPVTVPRLLRWWKLRRWLGLIYEIEVPNPEYRPGYFRIPDLRPHTLLATE